MSHILSARTDVLDLTIVSCLNARVLNPPSFLICLTKLPLMMRHTLALLAKPIFMLALEQFCMSKE